MIKARDVAVRTDRNKIGFLLANLQALMPYLPSDTVKKASVLFPTPLDLKQAKNDVMRQSFMEQVPRALGEDNTVPFVIDTEWYFHKKVKLMQNPELLPFYLCPKVSKRL